MHKIYPVAHHLRHNETIFTLRPQINRFRCIEIARNKRGVRHQIGSLVRVAGIYSVRIAGRGIGSLIRGGEQRCEDWRIARRLQVKPIRPGGKKKEMERR